MESIIERVPGYVICLSLTNPTEKTMFLEDTGGARARIKDVKITKVKSVTSLSNREGFQAHMAWSISGTVTHWGHSHNRLNNYEATIAFVPVDGKWKVKNIKLHEKLRTL